MNWWAKAIDRVDLFVKTFSEVLLQNNEFKFLLCLWSLYVGARLVKTILLSGSAQWNSCLFSSRHPKKVQEPGLIIRLVDLYLILHKDRRNPLRNHCKLRDIRSELKPTRWRIESKFNLCHSLIILLHSFRVEE